MASSPDMADAASNPERDNCSVTSLRNRGSSSTKRTLIFLVMIIGNDEVGTMNDERKGLIH
jgi:hypothetical protein